MSENEEVVAVPAAEAQREAAQTSDARVEATATASDELSEDDLEAVAGGHKYMQLGSTRPAR